MEHYINQQTEDFSTPLHIAVSNSNINTVLILLNEGAEPNMTNSNGNTPLHLSAKFKDVTIAHILLTFNASINFINNNDFNPLDYATFLNNFNFKTFVNAFLTGVEKKLSNKNLFKVYLPENFNE